LRFDGGSFGLDYKAGMSKFPKDRELHHRSGHLLLAHVRQAGKQPVWPLPHPWPTIVSVGWGLTNKMQSRFPNMAGFTVTDLMIVVAAAVILGAAIRWDIETIRYLYFAVVALTWLGAIVLVWTCLHYLKSGKITPAAARPFILSPFIGKIGPRRQAQIALAICLVIVFWLPAYLLIVFAFPGR